MSLPGKRGRKRGYGQLDGDYIDFEKDEKFSDGSHISGYDWDAEAVKWYEVMDHHTESGKKCVNLYDSFDGTVENVELDDED